MRFRDIYKNEGVRAFFKGGACRVIVIAPLFAIVQGVYFLGVGEKLLGIEKDAKVAKSWFLKTINQIKF